MVSGADADGSVTVTCFACRLTMPIFVNCRRLTLTECQKIPKGIFSLITAITSRGTGNHEVIDGLIMDIVITMGIQRPII